MSEIAFGTWLTFGLGVDRHTASACIKQAFDEGINLIDAANVYGRGAAEEALGDILAGYPRDSYLLAAKLYFPMSDTDRGLSCEQAHKQADASLKRLRFDYVDVYQCARTVVRAAPLAWGFQWRYRFRCPPLAPPTGRGTQ